MTIDCHLMIEEPSRYAVKFVEAGADMVSVHVEADVHLQRTLTAIREAEERLGHWVRFVEEHRDDTSGAALREWVLDGYRREGYSEDVLATYDTNTFWPMMSAGIIRWLEVREG